MRMVFRKKKKSVVPYFQPLVWKRDPEIPWRAPWFGWVGTPAARYISNIPVCVYPDGSQSGLVLSVKSVCVVSTVTIDLSVPICLRKYGKQPHRLNTQHRDIWLKIYFKTRDFNVTSLMWPRCHTFKTFLFLFSSILSRWTPDGRD